MRPADGLRAGFGEPEVLDLTGGDELADGAGDVFDGHIRVDPVLVENVDDVGTEVGQAGVDDFADVLRSAVAIGSDAGGVRKMEAELGGDHDLVSSDPKSAAKQRLVGTGAHATELGGVKEVMPRSSARRMVASPPSGSAAP